MEGQSLVYEKLKHCLANESCMNHFERGKFAQGMPRVNFGNLNPKSDGSCSQISTLTYLRQGARVSQSLMTLPESLFKA